MNVPSIIRSLPGIKQILELTDKVNTLEDRVLTLETRIENHLMPLIREQDQNIKHLKTISEEEDRVIKAIADSITKEQIQEIADRFGDRNLTKLKDTLVTK